MQYKVVFVSEAGGCCEQKKSIEKEIQQECNHWGSQGYVLVTAYRQAAQAATGAILIFARRTG
jgi:hypothetical protein